MAEKTPTETNLALACMRSALDWSQSELAEAAGERATRISDFERGKRTLTLERLTELASALGLPPQAVAQSRAYVRSIQQQAQPPGHHGPEAAADRRRIEEAAAQAGALAAGFTRSVLESVSFQARSLAAREHARILWTRMRKLSPSQRRELVEKDPEFRSWALCELVCKESIRAAADHAGRARELAELALLIAELGPGEGSWRRRLQGYAWAHVGNARRVGGDLPGAEKAFGRAGKLWETGEEGDPGILDEALLPGLEASLRIDQSRLAEAASLLDRALADGKSTFRKHLLLNRARLQEWAGNYQDALSTLANVETLVSRAEEPRLFWMLRFNCAWNLSHLGRYTDAESLIPEIRTLTIQLENELDSLRLRWLEGHIAAGLGKKQESLASLNQVRAGFAARGLAYDAALVTLELAVIQLEQGRTWEVKILARQMGPIFQAQGVHREALAAIRLFCEAAEKESATVELARRVTKYLYLAQHNPSLRFELLT